MLGGGGGHTAEGSGLVRKSGKHRTEGEVRIRGRGARGKGRSSPEGVTAFVKAWRQESSARWHGESMAGVGEVSMAGAGPWGFESVLKEFRLDPTGSKKPPNDLKQKLTSLSVFE